MLEKQVGCSFQMPPYKTAFDPFGVVWMPIECVLFRSAQVNDQLKENERLWAAIGNLTLRESDSNGLYRSGRALDDGGGRGGGFTNHGGRSAGASP